MDTSIEIEAAEEGKNNINNNSQLPSLNVVVVGGSGAAGTAAASSGGARDDDDTTNAAAAAAAATATKGDDDDDDDNTEQGGGGGDGGGSEEEATNNKKNAVAAAKDNAESTPPPELYEVEMLADRIETKRANRIVVTHAVLDRFVQLCNDRMNNTNTKTTAASVGGAAAAAAGATTTDNNHPYNQYFLPRDDLIALRDQIQNEVNEQNFAQLRKACECSLGIRNESKQLLQLLNRAVQRIDIDLKGATKFYYPYFAYYYVQTESRYWYMRRPILVTLMILMAYYIGTIVFFCFIVNDEHICPQGPGTSFQDGPRNALYFASVTVSSVGYGDVTVQKDKAWRLSVGALYIAISMIVLATAFATMFEQATSTSGLNPFMLLTRLENLLIRLWTQNLDTALLNEETGNKSVTTNDNKPPAFHYMKKKQRRIMWIRILILILHFVVLNLIGCFVARYFVNRTDIPEQQWDWATTWYWASQTITTVGYGDLDMPDQMKWFQVFFTVIATYFVGDTLAKVGALTVNMREERDRFAWSRIQLSDDLIEDFQIAPTTATTTNATTTEAADAAETAGDNRSNDQDRDDLNQYEFVVSSLLSLNIISKDDIVPIMDKYRELVANSPERGTTIRLNNDSC